MQNADFDRPLAAALHLTTDSCHQHGPRADGFAVVSFIVKTQIEIPPVVKQGNEVGDQAAGGKATRGVAAPSPLVFKFIEAVFSIASVTVIFGHDGGGKLYGI